MTNSHDDELMQACTATTNADFGYKGYPSPDLYLRDDVLAVLGRLGPVAAFNLALREMRKRVGENYHPLSGSSAEVGAH